MKWEIEKLRQDFTGKELDDDLFDYLIAGFLQALIDIRQNEIDEVGAPGTDAPALIWLKQMLQEK